MRASRIARVVLVAAISLLAVGCGAIGDYSRDALNDNREADSANNKQLLLNILRAKERRPEEITSLRQDTVTSTLQGQIGLSAPLREFGGTTALTLTPQGTITRQPQVVNDILDTQEFYEGFLQPLPLKTLDFYFGQGYPRAFLYHLFVAKIAISQGDHIFVAVNSVGDPALSSTFPEQYLVFRRIIESFFDARLATEPISESSTVGPPLKADEVKQRLRDIISASKDGLTLAYDEQTHEYRLKKSETSYRFCLQSEYGQGSSGEPASSDGVKKLLAAAIGLRCGASPEQRRNMQKAVNPTAPNVPGVAPQAVALGGSKALLGCKQAQLESGLSDDLKHYLTRYCDFANNLERLSGLHGSDKESLTIAMTTRSTESVLYYLGEVSRWRLADGRGILIPLGGKETARNEPLCGEAWTAYGMDGEPQLRDRYACLPMLVVNSGNIEPAFVSVEYDGVTYSVPATREAALSTQAFEIFHQLLALNKKGKDLPATTVLTVTGIP